jgi:MraZ protein
VVFFYLLFQKNEIGVDCGKLVGYNGSIIYKSGEKWNMFIGEYAHTLDQKGRIAIPAKFRSELKKGCVVTRGLDNCLFVYPVNEWELLAGKLASLPVSQSNTRAFSRLMLAGAMDVQLDKQGRIIIPDYLRNFASLTKKIVLAGLYNRLEIWNEEAWNTYKQVTEKDSVAIAENLDGLGI